MGEKVPKVWGTTECLLDTSTVQLHRINFVKGGVCSDHWHAHRWNGFYVISGELMISVGGPALPDDAGPSPYEALLRPGAFFCIDPGIVHRFEGLTDGQALELYYPPELRLNDIQRLNEGFMRGSAYPPDHDKLDLYGDCKCAVCREFYGR